ncbi:MAG: carboxypeptidase-like regulatory domain-containing protein, partial [Gammaproteobacteria bacterium]|nr:carboxypeptidase-like regulatory domain-containing protein [Gammaproteobacteria bacterium]
DMLDDDGNAAFMTTVGADDLPATFTFAVADDQDDKMDGGESYEGSAVDYTHTGLALAGTMDAGTIEVQYSTQTLKVYVHQERDQVMGYTGNLLGGDERDGSGDNQMVSVGLRYVDDNGRSRAFVAADSISSGNKDGVHTFNNVPADKNVIVQASKTDAASSIKLLDPDELAAYTGMEANGITGGAFGAMGGFNHTVELCPLQATAPQDHDECASFAYVTTHTVSGLVWKNGVKMSGDDFDAGEDVDGDGEGDGITTPVPGQTVSLSPVEGKNLAGEEESFTTAEKDTRKDKTKGLDATLQFSFDGVASGAYKLSVPDGWRAKMGDKGATADVGDALNPLGGPVSLDITPATATVYGRVDGGDGFPLEGVTVDVNGRTAMTDAAGRYIVDGVSAVRGKVFVSAAKEGQNAPKPDSTKVEFGANKVSRLDIDLSAVGQTASISGTVRASGTAAPVAGAEVAVTGAKVTNLVKGKLLTDAEGKYTAIVEAVALGTTVSVSVTKKGMSFAPPSIGGLPAHANSAISGIDFTGFVHATITGVVVAPGGGPLSGVALSATSTTDSTLVVHDTTGVTGRFSLSVPYGGYTVAASLANHIFGDPTASSTGWTVPTAPGVTVDIGRIQAMTAMARNVRATRETDTTTVAGVSTYNGNVTVRWIDSADDVPDGYSDAVYSIQTNTGTDGAWEGAASAALAGGDTTGLGRFDAGTNDGEVMVRVVATAAADGSVSTITEALVLNSDAGTLAAVNTAPSGAAARRQDEDATTDSLVVTWSATSNPRTQ